MGQQTPVKASKSTKNTKYASKLTGYIIEDLIKDYMKTNKKNSKMVEKWLGKMKVNIQKKVSILSKDAFVPSDSNPKLLKAEIEGLRKGLLKQSKDLTNNVKNIIEANKDRMNVKTNTNINTYSTKTKEFSNKVEELSTTFSGVAESITTMKQMFNERTKMLNETFNLASKTLNESDSGNGSNGSGNNKKSGSPKRPGKPQDDSNPMKKLAKHMSK